MFSFCFLLLVEGPFQGFFLEWVISWWICNFQEMQGKTIAFFQNLGKYWFIRDEFLMKWVWKMSFFQRLFLDRALLFGLYPMTFWFLRNLIILRFWINWLSHQMVWLLCERIWASYILIDKNLWYCWFRKWRSLGGF